MKSKSIPLFSVSRSSLFLGMCLTMVSQAADQTWMDSNTNNDWNSSSASTPQLNWDSGAPWTQANNAIFGGTGEIVTLTEGISVGNITFNSGGYTISGNTLTLGASTIHTGANNAAISSAVAGTSLTKDGAGTLTLSSANTFAGSTTVNGGSLLFTAPQFTSFATSALQVAGGATAEFRTLGDAVTNAPITGSGTVLASGSGTSLRMGGNNNSFTGTFETANSGAIDFVNVSQGWSANADYVHNGSWIRFYNSTTNRTIDFGSLAGTTADSQIGSWNGTGPTVLSVGANGHSTSFAGKIVNQFGGSAIMALTKVGTGTLTLSGANTYTGATNVNAGTLAVDGSLAAASAVTVKDTATLTGSGTVNGTVSVQSGGTLAGTGTLATTVTIASGATLAPAGAAAIGTLTANGTVNLAGNTVMELNKSDATLTSDQIAGSGNLNVSGTLTVTASGDALALDDEFTLFAVSGGKNITFSTPPTLPALPAGMSWDLSDLSITGSIKVVNYTGTPIFNPPSGGHLGTPALTITSDSGSTIYYTLDGSTPTTASSSGASPLALGNLPANASAYTVKAFATKPDQADSPVATAVYYTANTAQWNVDNNGNWSDPTMWLNNVIPSGVDAPADFSFEQSADTTVTLDSNRSVGSLHFGNANDITWTISSSNSSVLTLATSAGTPSISVDAERSATITAPVTTTQGLTKSGTGNLTLSNANTYTGATTVDGGSLVYTGPQWVSFATSALQVAGGTTAEFQTLADAVTNAAITGSGTVLASGSGTSLRMGGNNSSFTGTFKTANSGAIDFVNVSQGWSANADYVHDGDWIRFYNTTTNRTIDFGSLAGTTADSQVGTWNGAGTTVLSLGANGHSTSFAGRIVNSFNGSGTGIMALTKVGTGTLTLSGANTYTGATNINAGTLIAANTTGSATGSGAVTVAASGTLGGTGFVSGSVTAAGILAPGTDGTGTLTTGAVTLTGTYQCQLDGASCDKLAAGTLTLTGATLAISTVTAPTASSYLIATYTGTAPAFTTVTGIPSGYSLDTATTGQIKLVKPVSYDEWASQITNGLNLRTNDADGDGFNNLQEFLFGTNPMSGNGSPMTTQAAGGNLELSWLQRETGSTYTLKENANLSGTWTTVASPLPAADGDQTGVPTDYDRYKVTLPIGADKNFFRIEGVEN